jgi:C4-dicarboxylate-specific signal transduction histidine kinase
MSQQSIQVLLVEDNAADAALLRVTLAESQTGQFNLTHVQRLDQGIDLLARESFDVVLLDLGLPDSQGLQTLRRMRKHALITPIVVMTARADDGTAMEALREGANDYLVKSEMLGSSTAKAIRYAIERKRSDDTARSRDIELAHLSRVNMMGQMAAGLAHELNQPLSAISIYASVCLEQIKSGKNQRETMLSAMEEVANEARRAGTIISRLRSFVRKQQPQSAAVDVNVIVEESIGILGSEFRQHKMRPRLILNADLPKAMADVVQIEQVLVNLIYNALEAMLEPGSSEPGLTIATELTADAASVQVSVIDNGPGISPENLEKLFQPFFTTKTKGMGMGLNISRTIIESHGGKLNAIANEDGGMRFSFTLPVARGVTP